MLVDANTIGEGWVMHQRLWTCDPYTRPTAIPSRKKMVQRHNRHFNPRLLALIVVVVTLGAGAVFNGQMSKLGIAVSTNPQTATTSGAYFDHLVVIMMEDEGISNVCGGNPPPCNGSTTPYLSSLANSYGIGQQYLSLIPQSWPDYYGILGASIFGCPSNCYPAPGSINAPNLVDRFQAAGVSWKAYMENQNVAMGCDTGNQEPYEYGHNGFVAFQDIVDNSARCDNIVLANPGSCGSVTDCALVNDLNSGSAPNFMWLTPNDCNNMHATSVCTNGCTSDGSTTCMTDGDNYLSSLVPNILDSLTFRTERSALFVVFDEGEGYCPLNGSSENCVYDVWAGPVAKTGFSTATEYSHYSLTKTIETNWNLPSLTNNDANAKPMSEFFTSTPPVQFTTSFTYSPSSPQTGQQVAFTAIGSGGTTPYSFTWSFGDGTNGTGATTYHTYSKAGNYTVVLTSKDSSSLQQTATSQQTLVITTPPPPPSNLTASFSASVSNPSVGENVSFTGSATGGIQPYAYSWSFGDSSSGAGQSLDHSYQSPGTYNVVLTVTDSASHKATSSQTITVIASLSTSFTYSPSNPSILQSIQFTSSTTGGTGPYSCNWDFGDGTSGTGATATHSYAMPGSYNVTLTVTDANGQTATATETVTVGISVTL
jgi:PKD repeat protein